MTYAQDYDISTQRTDSLTFFYGYQRTYGTSGSKLIPWFTLNGFLAAVIFAIILSLINMVLGGDTGGEMIEIKTITPWKSR